jgi:ribose 1,5-bisphosphate isomerase
VLESLPGGEGRTFARELRRAGLRARTVTDTEGRRLVGATDLVLIGADTVSSDGSVVHKVGTRPLALAARRAGVPVIVVAGRSKNAPDPHSARRLPPRFDRTPARAIQEYWTDEGRVPSAKWSRHTARGR